MAIPTPAFSDTKVIPQSADGPKPLSREEARAAGRAKAEEERKAAALEAGPAAGALLKADDAAEKERRKKAMEAFPERRPGRERDVVDGMSEYRLVPVEDIERDQEQPRKVLRNIAELAASIKSEGLLQPITVRPDDARPGKLVIIYGERRFAAMKSLHWETIPAMIRYDKKSGSVLAKQLIENVQRDAMDLMDEAKGIRALMREQKMTGHLEAAARLGKSQSWVSNRLALLDLDDEQQEEVAAGKLSLVEGAAIARARTGNIRAKRSNTGGRAPASGGEGNYDLPMRRPEPAPSFPVQKSSVGHLGEQHFLAGRARSRCNAQTNVEGADAHRPVIGTVACGKCWEVVIRLDAHRNPDVVFRDNDR